MIALGRTEIGGLYYRTPRRACGFEPELRWSLAYRLAMLSPSPWSKSRDFKSLASTWTVTSSASTSGELLDELEHVSVAGRLGGLDLLHLAFEGGPTHAVGLVDGIADAAVRPKRYGIQLVLRSLWITTS